MSDIWAVLTQPLNLWAYTHVIAGAILSSGAAMFAGISAYFLMKKRDVDVFRPVGAARPGRHADRRSLARSSPATCWPR